MCGLVGVASRIAVADRSWLAAGRDAMRHRGPDDAGEWWSEDGRVGLGHRRLSIVDLSTAGHQPMQDPRGEVTVVFNGEIYNYRDLQLELGTKGHTFHSRSDTEVLLSAYHEWDTECLSRLNGMFAFAIYDSSRERLFLARDRAGEKPLFYALGSGELRLSSELKGLMADPAFPRQVDPEALDCYLAMGYVPGERCILAGVRKLPPAHALTFSLRDGQARVWRYWTLPELSPTVASTEEDALIGELDTLLADAVRRQLMADVPVGVLLSGGVDSSLVTAMAVRATANVKTFTIRFPGYSQYDETEHARLIARHFGTDHCELDATAATPELLPMLTRQFDEPIVDSSIIPTFLLTKLIRNHCTVALGGDGGDELFGGYQHYSRLLWMQKNVGRLPRPVRHIAAVAAEGLLPVGVKGRNWLQGLDVDLQKGLPLIATYFDPPSRRRLLSGRDGWRTEAAAIRRRALPTGDALLQRATRADFETYLPEDILVKVDRASMLNSLEVRAPFLDYRVVEFAFRQVPSHLKATATTRKVLLKRLAERVLPTTFDRKRKQGFSIPLGSWLRAGTWRTAFSEVLLAQESTLFDRKVVKGLLDGQAKGRANSERLFALVMFELWRREYRVSA